MKHYPSRRPGPAHIESDHAAEIRRALRWQRWCDIGQVLAAAALGLVAGLALALGYAADVLPWLGR